MQNALLWCTKEGLIRNLCWFVVNYFSMVLGKGEGIVISPHVAGHLLGGTVWKITKDGEDVIYAVDFNHRKEKYRSFNALDFDY